MGPWQNLKSSSRCKILLSICLYKSYRQKSLIYFVFFIITILKNVREGRHEEAVEVMERHLEDDLISIEPDHRIKEGTLSAINGAIQNAKDYRTQYPRTPSRPSIEKMVEDVFKRAPYK